MTGRSSNSGQTGCRPCMLEVQMKRALVLITAALLLIGYGGAVFADDPVLLAKPDLRSDPAAPGGGGSATVNGGNAGPANLTMSEPFTASSGNTASQQGSADGGTTASGPGTSANAPARATRSDPAAPEPSTEAPQTSSNGPTADADVRDTTVTATPSHVSANNRSRADGGADASASHVGSASDPTQARTCTGADATPGTPSNVDLDGRCDGSPSTVSEDAFADSQGGRASGSPTLSSCLLANATAMDPRGKLSSGCTSPDGQSRSGVTVPIGTTGTGLNSGASPRGSSCATTSVAPAQQPGVAFGSSCQQGPVGPVAPQTGIGQTGGAPSGPGTGGSTNKNPATTDTTSGNDHATTGNTSGNDQGTTNTRPGPLVCGASATNDGLTTAAVLVLLGTALGGRLRKLVPVRG